MRYILLFGCLLFTLNVFAQDHKFKNDPRQEQSDLTPPTVYTYVEQMPDPGYDMITYLKEHIKYPDSAIKFNIEGRMILKFVINEDGSASDFEIIKSLSDGCNEEAIRVLRTMPKWKPGMHNGLPVRVSFTLPVTFELPKKVYTYVEQMPVPLFDMHTYLAGNLHYPEVAAEKHIAGRVLVKFIVTETGTIDSVHVVKGVGGGCDQEAFRVVSAMPEWKPGRQNGKPVAVYFTMPIIFAIH